MNKKSLLNFWLLLLCMIVGSGTAWAADETETIASFSSDSHDGWTITKADYATAGGGYYKLISSDASIVSPSISWSEYTNITITISARKFGGPDTTQGKISVSQGETELASYSPSGTSIVASSALSINPIDGTITISCPGASNNKGCGVQSIIIKGTKAGGSGIDSDLALTGAPVALNFDLYNNTSDQFITYTTSSTGAVTVSASDYVTTSVDAENKTITVTPKTSVTPSPQTITVSQAADETYNAGSVTFTVTITDSTPIPTHIATFSVNGATSTGEFEEGAEITFPDDPADISGKTFVGWVTEAIDGTTDEAPEFVTSAVMGDADITYYAVFAELIPGEQTEVTDVLTRATTGITSTTYTNWSGKTANSDAVYAGQSAGGNSSIQMRATSPSGIITTKSGGKVKKVVVDWNSSTSSGRAIAVCVKNSAYESSANLYSVDNKGTELDTRITYGTSTELNIDGDYEYVGIRAYNGALYLNSVSITWVTGTPDTYSGYCTTVAAVAVEKPVITVAANPFLFSTTATITCATDGAAIHYSYDGENWNDYTETLTITETKTIYAKATKNEDESAVAQVTVTKNLAMPTVTIDASGITNTNVFDGTDAGSLAAAVTYNEEAVEGAVVTWSGNNDEVATIDAETGAVTLVGAGSVTFTATYAGNGDYSEKTATYEMTVTNTDPNAPGSENNPFTVAQAIDAIDAGTDLDGKYVHGIISQVDSYNSSYKSITYWISDDGTTTSQIKVYSGKGLNNTDFSAKSDLQEGDIVTVYGDLLIYGTTYEVNYNNYITSLTRKAEPELAYETTAYETFPGDDEFVAPTLTNPHDLTVTYSSSDEDVALVDENTGEIALGDVEGTATITATFAGNETYKAGNASYTITLTKLEAGLAYTETEFEVQVGKSFTAPTLTNPNNLTVTYSSSDEDVALVDENTGEVVVGEAGEATITATFAGNTKFNAAAVSYTLTVISGKLNPELTVTESVSMNARTTKAITGLYTVTSTGAVTFMSSDETVAAVVEGVLETYKNGSATITVNVAETEDYGAASADIAVTVTALPDVPAFNPAAAGGFVKVTATEDIVDGDYLIVYEDEEGNVAFDGSLETLDYSGNVIEVEINDGRIAESDETNAAVFTIDVTNGTLMSASGYYIGVPSNSNGLKQTEEASTYKNTFEIDEEGNAVISADFVGSTMTLRFNTASNQNRFRYYKSGQQDIQLYRHQSASLTIGSTGWRTLVASENVQFPDNLTAYIVSSKDDNTAYLKKVSAVKANVPVLLKGEEGNYTLTVVDEAECDNTDSNLLRVSETDTYENVFVLANKSNGVGFYKWTGGWMGAGRVYLPVEPEAGVRGFISFNTDGETTGIAEVNSNNVNVENVAYDLQGRKVKDPKKGLYIVNGTKVFIK